MRAALDLGLVQRQPRRRGDTASLITAPERATPDDRGLSDNRTRYMAQSALTGLAMRDGGPAPLLPLHEALDVLRWAHGHTPPH